MKRTVSVDLSVVRSDTLGRRYNVSGRPKNIMTSMQASRIAANLKIPREVSAERSVG